MTASGIVALGDSQLACDSSWAVWLARATGQELTVYAVPGATSTSALSQLGVVEGRYALAAVSIGSNDVIKDWDRARFEDNLGVLVAGARKVAERVAISSLALGIAHFAGGGTVFRRRVEEANRVIEAAGCDAVADASDLHGHRLVATDRIHLTTAGHQLIADRAAARLGLGVTPSQGAGAPDTTFSWRAHGTWTANKTARGIAKRVLGRPPEYS